MTQKIEVEDGLPKRPGKRVMAALVGPDPQFLSMFEMRQVRARARGKARVDYYVEDLQVSREAYMDALQTAALDRYVPCDDDCEHVAVPTKPDEALS